MSYILDALKKSEAERSSADPGESGHRVSFASTPGKQREIWPYLLAVALMANAAVVAYLAWPESGAGNGAEVPAEVAPVPSPQPEEEATVTTAPEPPAQENAPEENEAPETASASKPSDDSSPVASEEEPPVSSAESTETGSAETDGNPSEDVPPIHDMPRSIQQRVPEMTFNGHVWSSRSSSRSVMINNRLLREGARFEGLVIEEITTAGVVFRMDGHVFEIDVVRDWQGGS